MSEIIKELRRRHVFRTAGYYIVGAWVLLQAGDVVLEPAGLPLWVMQVLLYLVLLGFPLSLYLGWRYDITADGIVRTPPSGEAGDEDLSLKASDYLIFAALLFVVGLGVVQLLPVAEDTNDATGGEVVAVPEVAVAEQTAIAVMPFADLSLDGSQAFLGDGISDTVTHVLSRVGELTVTSRTSAFALRDMQLSVQEIGERLNVTHVLEGSVQRSGTELRVITRLIEVSSGQELWSGSFRNQVDDIFGVQDAISQEVVAAMKLTLLPGENGDDRYVPDLLAYEQIILGRAQRELGTNESWLNSRRYFEKATELDPGYAEAWVELAETFRLTTRTHALTPVESSQIRRPMLERALDLDPLLPAAHTAMGFLLRTEGDIEGSTESFRRAIALNANHAEAYAGLGSNLFRAGDFQASLDAHERATQLNPEDNQFQIFLANAYWSLAQSERAIGVIQDNIRKRPEISSNYSMMVYWLQQLGRIGEALKYQVTAVSKDPNDSHDQLLVCEIYYLMLQDSLAKSCRENHRQKFPDDLRANISYLHVEGRYEEALRQVNELMQTGGGRQMRGLSEQRIMLLSQLGRHEEVVASIRAAYPGLFEAIPIVDDWSIWMSTDLVNALVNLGDTERAWLIANEGIDLLSRRRRMQGGAHLVGAEDVSYYAALGERELMIDALDRTISLGWVNRARTTLELPWFARYQNDPGFVSVREKLEENLASQWRWYQENADQPI